ncbi:MAG: hypothetical protein U0446_00935 [Dehalococcoidia bacterium]
MSIVEELMARHDPALRGHGPAVPEEFAVALRSMEPILSPEDLEAWAAAGVDLAGRSLRSWEAAVEYFRVGPRIANQLPFNLVMYCAETAGRITEGSPPVAAAFLRAAPEVIPLLPLERGDSVGIMGEEIPLRHAGQGEIGRWARMGERLHRGNWKSVALASLFYELTPRLLDPLRLHLVEELVEVIDLLSDRSYQLATICLESSPELFAGLRPADREPFLRFARAVTRASWADTRLYFERGPQLIQGVEQDDRETFLDIAAKVVTAGGRQGFPHFVDAATALATVPTAEHQVLIALATHIAKGSPVAAMSLLSSAPSVLTRLTTDQLGQWAEPGSRLLFEEGNIEGAEAYFRLESVRAEQALAALSARVELTTVGSLLRMYAKALTGEQVAIRSAEELVDKGIGWVTESVATTEGTSIYLPPFVGSFPDQAANFQCYKVFTTHQTGRIEFGSFAFRFGEPGVHTPATVHDREAQLPARERPVITSMERFYDLFEDRDLIAALFTIVEDTRIDAYVAREYGGIRVWLQRLQAFEAERRPDVRTMALRAAFCENLLRSSLGRPDRMLWPRELSDLLRQGLNALKIVEQPGALVQDSAEVAAALYDLVTLIPNLLNAFAESDWVEPDEDMLTMYPSMPAGKGDQAPMPHSEEGVDFEAPGQPDFRGDFKPELVQLLAKLKQQGQEGDGEASPLTREQLMEMLQKSAEINISEMIEAEFAESMGMFLDNLEKEAATPASTLKAKKDDDGGDDGGGAGEGEEQPLELEITWSYYDEWDFRASDYRPRWCRVGERLAEEGETDFYDETLRKHHGLVTDTRRQFEMMRPESFRRIKRLEDGEEIDLDRSIEFIVDKRAGVGPLAQVYWRRNKVERDVAVAFLMDMSASTDEEIDKQKVDYSDDDDFNGDPRNYFQWLSQRRALRAIEPPKRIVDLEKESLVMIVEALEAIGDSYGIYGFSGYGRDNVEYHVIKDLGENFSDRVRRRIDKIQPIRSTRMGPAVRHTVAKLNEYDAKVKILILVSDGRPQDHGYGRDRTEKEYAVHDTHQALMEAKRSGIVPFLITVDKEGHDYMKQMCSDVGYEVVDEIEQLPRRLTTLYRALAAD